MNHFHGSLLRTAASHMRPINGVKKLTELERNGLDRTNLGWALWSNGWCFPAAASPLHLSGGLTAIYVFNSIEGAAVWSARYSALRTFDVHISLGKILLHSSIMVLSAVLKNKINILQSGWCRISNISCWLSDWHFIESILWTRLKIAIATTATSASISMCGTLCWLARVARERPLLMNRKEP